MKSFVTVKTGNKEIDMGYATITRVPYIYSYEQALKKWQSTKPIRGREPEIRPLGERRDCDRYSIRKNVWTDVIELVLYKTPVVKFTPDNEVILNFGPWSSSSTCQFISGVLASVRTHRQNGAVVLEFKDGSKAMLGQHEELTLVKDAHGNWALKDKQTLYDYRVNRKEANNVRKLVSQFHDYMSGMIKLRAEKVEGVWGREGFSSVVTTYADLSAVFGEIRQTGGSEYVKPDVDKWIGLAEKPKHCPPEYKDKRWTDYRERARKFFDLVRNDQDDNARYQNYWIAFNILFVQEATMYWRANSDTKVSVNIAQFERYLYKTLFTLFADKVFTKVALAEGKVPSGRYDDYMLTED